MYKNIFCLLLFVFIFFINEVATSQVKTNILEYSKKSNSCGVTADFSNRRDSIFTNPITLTFTSTSTGAISYKWYRNGFLVSSTANTNILLYSPGLFEIMLVASNGSCSDTARGFYTVTGLPPNSITNYKMVLGTPYYENVPKNIDTAANGGYVICSNVILGASTQPEIGVITKISEGGCIEWSKYIPLLFVTNYSLIKQLRNGDICLVGNGGGQGFYGNFIMRISAAGDFIWAKQIPIASYTFKPSQVLEDNQGDLILSGGDLNGFSGIRIVKLNANGNWVWGKYFANGTSDFGNTYSVVQFGESYFITGDFLENSIVRNSLLIKLRSIDGVEEWTKKVIANGAVITLNDLHVFQQKLLIGSYNESIKVFQAYHYVDTSGNIIKSKKINNNTNQTGNLFCDLLPQSNGTILAFNRATEFINLQPGYINQSRFLKINSDDQIVWQKYYAGADVGYFFKAVYAPNGGFAALGREWSSLLKPLLYDGYNNLFAKIDSNGNVPANCNFSISNSSIESYSAVSQTFTWPIKQSFTANISSSTFELGDAYTTLRYYCQQSVKPCSYVKIEGLKEICKLNDTYSYRIHKDPGCIPQFIFKGNPIVIYQSDTILQLRFPSPGKYTIFVKLSNSCSSATDSISITAAPRSFSFSLGADTVLCKNTTISLNAGNGFLSYQWQNGSTNPNFIVSDTGYYYVTVTDSCFNRLSDTIHIGAAVIANINVGPDRVKCNKDSLVLNAPAGYFSYQWLPAYNIIGSSQATVTVFPAIDTSYYLSAIDNRGCSVKDTVKIKVNRSPNIFLGNDTSICRSQPLLINAGHGFNSYQWSNGQTSQLVYVNQIGTYWVIATDTNQCKSTDTIRIIDVYNDPIISLPTDTVLCTGKSITAIPGNGYASYLWQDGSTANTYTVSSPGLYWVSVTDINKCTKRDSFTIQRMIVPPSGFLQTSTDFCMYDSVKIAAMSGYASYLWSTGATNSYIIVYNAGDYVLNVTDNYKCVGTEKISVKEKECYQAIFFPNAFTPNNDRLNDTYKPKVYGRLIHFSISIFNRFGQLIFNSNEWQKGWDGTFKGIPQDRGVFVWYASYQFPGGVKQTQKGTIELLR